MIKNEQPISMSESALYLGKEEKGAELSGFIKKFTKLKQKDGKEMRQKFDGLQMMKLKPENISKVIDLLPDNSEDLNKIFTDIGLDEDETRKILDIVKEYK